MPAEPFAEAGADYIEQLLRAAIHAPAAAGDPASGRIVARLMVVLLAKGEGGRLERYLAFRPGQTSVYDVSTDDLDDRPSGPVTDLTAEDAVRAAARLAADHHRAHVVSRGAGGEQRRVLTIEGSTATYLFAPWSASEPSAAAGSTDGAPTAAQWSQMHTRLASLPTVEEMVGAVSEVLGAVTIQIDAAAIEDVVVTAMEHGSTGAEHGTGGAGFDASAIALLERLGRAVDGLAGRMPTAADIADRLAVRLSGGPGLSGADHDGSAEGQLGDSDQEHEVIVATPVREAARQPLDPAAEDALAAGDPSGARRPGPEPAGPRRAPASGRVVVAAPRVKP